MVYCDKCDNVYHMNCMQPTMQTVPTSVETWFCSRCVECKSCNKSITSWGYTSNECVQCREDLNDIKDVVESLLLKCENRASITNSQTSVNSVRVPFDTQISPNIAKALEGDTLTLAGTAKRAANAPVETIALKKARLKKERIELQLSNAEVEVMEAVTNADREARRSQFIAEYELVESMDRKALSEIKLPSRVDEENICSVCEKVCTSNDNYSCCHLCGNTFHRDCGATLFSLPSYPWIDFAVWGEENTICCKSCLSRCAHNEASNSSVGDIALTVIGVQRLRSQLARIGAAAKLETVKADMAASWGSHWVSYVAVLNWAATRIAWFETTNTKSLNSFVQSKNQDSATRDLLMPVWIRQRAVRFLIGWRRRESNARQFLEQQKSFLRGNHLGTTNDEATPTRALDSVDAGCLSRLASGAAALLYATATDVPSDRLRVELNEVAESLINFMQCEKSGNGFSSANQLYSLHDAMNLIQVTLNPIIQFNTNLS